MVLVKNHVKEVIKNEGFNSSEGIFEELEGQILTLIKRACQRAEANGRKTVQNKDF